MILKGSFRTPDYQMRPVSQWLRCSSFRAKRGICNASESSATRQKFVVEWKKIRSKRYLWI